MLRALSEYSIVGVETNLGFFREILRDAEFREGRFEHADSSRIFSNEENPRRTPTHELELWRRWLRPRIRLTRQPETRNEKRETSLWLSEGRSGMLR